MKRRFLVIFILVLSCFLLQSTILHTFAMGSITPNLLIVITSTIGFMRGKKEGMLTGFLSGLLIDLFFSNYLGFQALFYMLIGYCNGYFQRLFFNDDVKLPLALIAMSEFIYGIGIFTFGFLLRSRFGFSFYFMNIIMPEFVYTLLATLLLYPLVKQLNSSLEESERRRLSKFV